MKAKKSWREKLANDNGLPKVEELHGAWARKWPGGTVAIPAPREVDAFMRMVPPGKLITVADIREAVARKHGATVGCPLTAGIFAWIAAHASDEASQAGETEVTPYWRTLKIGGELNPKYPGGAEHQRALLEAEGHTISVKGSKLIVRDYQDRLASLP
jgi:alkylated DNA nucleotide flippase Atl1